MKSPVDGATRRSLLRTIGAGAVATSVVAGSAGAQEGGVAERFEFEGETPGWVGVAPSSIEGETNPTLSLEAGETYEFHWENTDGAPHNVVIEDADGNNIVQSEYVSSEGETQTVEFTASAEMDSYYCGAHPSSMRGDVEVSGGSASTATGTGTGTEDGTETEDGTATGTGGETHEVRMVTSNNDDYYFDPIGLHIQPGDTIRWVIESGSHNVVSYDERIPEGADTFETEIISEGAHELSFSTEGTYDYYCMPHQSMGMVGRFVVGEAGGPAEGSMPGDGDVPESSAIVEQGSISYDEFTSDTGGDTDGDTDTDTDGGGDSDSTATATEPEETGEVVTTADPDGQDDTTEANGPGFTIGGALGAIGAGALLKAYRNRDE